MQDDEIRDEVQAEMEKLLHEDEPRTKTLDSSTLRAPISEIHLRKLVTVEPDVTVAEAVRTMVDHRQGCVLVVDEDHLVGIFTERDVLTRVVGKALDPRRARVHEVMSPNPEALTPETRLTYALNLMHLGGYRHVPIADENGRPVGVLSVRDALAYLADFFPEDVLALPPRPDTALPLHGG